MQILFPACLIMLVVLWGIFSPATMATVFGAALSLLTKNFGWLYLWVVLGLVFFAAYVAFSRYGNLKLGNEDDEPEFSVGSWFAMLFAAGMGIGLVFWGVAEPVSHYVTPPPGITAGTPEAANAAMRYVFFHWGIHPWAVYSIVALAIAFFQYRRGGLPMISTVTGSLPWRWVRSLSGVFNGLAIVATAFGVAASLGVGALQINTGMHAVFGLDVSKTWQIVIIVVTAAVFMTSAVTGVEKGIKYLSNFNIGVAVLLAITVFVLGPTVAIIDTFSNTLGSYLTDIVRMSLRSTPFRDSEWVGNWTIFYWAWWISWSPFVGAFIARVSYGRTVREFVLGVVVAPSLLGFAWFSTFGGTALWAQLFGGADMAGALAAGYETVLFSMYEALPLGGLLSGLSIVLLVIFFVTSADSAVLVLGSMSSESPGDPTLARKFAWGIAVALIAAAMLVAGGLDALQTLITVAALPFALLMVAVMVGLYRVLALEALREKAAERRARRAIEDWIAREQKQRALSRRSGDAAGSRSADPPP